MATATFICAGTDETQDLTLFTATAGTVTSATDQVHTGTRSLKLNTSNPAVTASARRDGILADAGRRVSFWWRTSSFAVLPSACAQGRQSDATTIVWNLRSNTGPVLELVPTGATTVTGTTVLTANRWYRICVSYYITNTTTFAIKVYLNGVLELTATAGTLTNTASAVLIFIAGSGDGVSVNRWIDNIYVDDGASSSSQPDTGNIFTAPARPVSNGTANNFPDQVGAGGSGYGSGHAPQVNEQPASDTNGWSVIAVGATTEEYTVEAQGVGSSPSGAIVDYMGWVRAKALIAETGSIKVGGTSSNIALTSTITTFIKGAGSTTYPAGLTDIGIVTDATATTVTLYECGIVVAYILNIVPVVMRQYRARRVN